MADAHSHFSLTLLVNHACNLRCTYCYTGAKVSRPMSVLMGFHAIDRALDQLVPGGDLAVGFFGGEPLLEPERVLAWMTHAREQARETGGDVSFRMTTNGTRTAGKAWEILQASDLALTVSMDGTPATHDRHRRSVTGEGSSAIVNDTLQRLVDSARDFRVAVVLRPDTLPELCAGLRHLRGLGVRGIDLSLDLWTRWTPSDLDRLDTVLLEAAALWWRWMPDFSVGWFDEKFAALTGVPEAPAAAACGFGFGEVAVAPSGRLYPCERLIGEDLPDNPHRLPGNVMDSGALPLGHANPLPEPGGSEACGRCVLKSACDTACRCSNYVRTGRTDRPDLLLCRRDQAVTEAVARLLIPSHPPSTTSTPNPVLEPAHAH